MSTFNLSKNSLTKLTGVHPDLVKVVKRAIELTTVDFGVTEGRRTVERQAQLVKAGASQTMKSRHLTGHAVDLVAYIDGDVRWDWPLFYHIATAMKKASEEMKVPVRWGGTWSLLSKTAVLNPEVLSKKFPDGPHFELPADKY